MRPPMRWERLVAFAFAAAAGVVATTASGCSGTTDAGTADGGAERSSGLPTDPAPSEGGTTRDAGDGFKPRARGLMARNGPPPATGACALSFADSTVVDVAWAKLQPNAPGDAGAGFDEQAFAPLDLALQRYHVRLRIHAGVDAPAWVKKLGGPARSFPGSTTCDASGGIEVLDPAGNQSGCVPYFWQANVKDAYQGLMREIARRYESNENLAEVVDGMCMTSFDEVLYRDHCEARTVENLVAAGFDIDGPEGDYQCQADSLSILASTFSRTRVSLAANGWDVVSKGTCTRDDMTRTRQLVAWASPLLGARLVLQHNHLAPADGCDGGAGAADSCFIAAYTGPRGFQTQAASKLSTPELVYATLANGVSLHAEFIELPAGCIGDPSTLAGYDAHLRQQRP